MSKIFAHRRNNFLYKRAHNDVGSGVVLNPSQNGNPGNDVSSNSPAADTPVPNLKTSPAINPFTTPVDPQPTDSATTPAAPTTQALPTPATSLPSSPSASPSQASSSAVSASSSANAHSTPSTASTPSHVATSASAYVATSFAPQAATHASFTPGSTLSPSSTSSATPSSSSGTNTGAIIGGIAGTLAGIAVLGFLLMWCMRRQRNKDFEDFDAQAFKRQSAILVDDPVEPSGSYNPRPPTMIERHNASPALAAQSGFGGQNFYGNYAGFGQQQPYPPDMIQPAGPPPQGYGAQPMGFAAYSDPQPSVVGQPHVGHAVYDGQQQLGRQPSNATYLSRQPTSATIYSTPPVPLASHDPGVQYVDLNRSSVTPYQAAQYADISRQLGTSDPNSQEPVEMPDGPLPSPFDDPVDVNPPVNHPATVAAPGPITAAPVQQAQGNPPESHRPATLYEVDDAYGGI